LYRQARTATGSSFCAHGFFIRLAFIREHVKEHNMIFDHEIYPQHDLSHLIQRASAETGFSASDIVALVDSDLETDHLLDYINAVMADRMN
jgi:hypothetical protein